MNAIGIVVNRVGTAVEHMLTPISQCPLQHGFLRNFSYIS